MVQQRFNGFEKPDRVRQFRMTFEGFEILPSRVNAELVWVANGAKTP